MTNAQRILSFALILFLTSGRSVFAASTMLTFSPASLELTNGQTGSVEVVLDPAVESVVGVDLFIKFDPKYIKVTKLEDLKAFSSSPVQSINNDAGTLKTGLSNNYGVYTTGVRSVVKLTLEAKENVESTNIAFDFTKGKTTDSNVVVTGGTDALESVNNLTVKISNSAAGASPTLAPTPTVVPRSDKEAKDIIKDIKKSVKSVIDKLNPIKQKTGSVKGAESEIADGSDSQVSKINYFYYVLGAVIVIISALSGYFVGKKRRL